MGWQPIAGDADAIHDNVAAEIDALTEVAPVAGDWLIGEDTSDSDNKKKFDATHFLTGSASHAWSDWTPTWTATGVNPAIGNGALAGRFLQIDDTVFFTLELDIGSTTTLGTGVWQFTFPAAPTYSDHFAIGSVLGAEDGVGWHAGVAFYHGPSGTMRIADSTAGSTAGSLYGPTVSMSWADGDRLTIVGHYEAA